jgi:hypothetical protein
MTAALGRAALAGGTSRPAKRATNRQAQKTGSASRKAKRRKPLTAATLAIPPFLCARGVEASAAPLN